MRNTFIELPFQRHRRHFSYVFFGRDDMQSLGATGMRGTRSPSRIKLASCPLWQAFAVPGTLIVQPSLHTTSEFEYISPDSNSKFYLQIQTMKFYKFDTLCDKAPFDEQGSVLYLEALFLYAYYVQVVGVLKMKCFTKFHVLFFMQVLFVYLFIVYFY